MRYWLDTEFIEDGKTIDLISIGIVAEDGREYYAINDECDYSKASPWVVENVLKPMGINVSQSGVESISLGSILFRSSRKAIAYEIMKFIKQPEEVYSFDELKLLSSGDAAEFWAYYADYDWVVFCQLFGTMMDLPKDFPMYCRDIKQECDRLGNPKLPEQKSGVHNALEDAKHNKVMWEFLTQLAIKVDK